MLAVSTAAEELTPFPSGTCDATTIRAPAVSGIPRSRASDEEDAGDVRHPVRHELVREHLPRLVVADRHAARRQRLERNRARRPAEADDLQDGTIDPLHGGEGGFRDRTLQHERPE